MGGVSYRPSHYFEKLPAFISVTSPPPGIPSRSLRVSESFDGKWQRGDPVRVSHLNPVAWSDDATGLARDQSVRILGMVFGFLGFAVDEYLSSRGNAGLLT
jgi:hypothetical protein